jgi:hypothetical protein
MAFNLQAFGAGFAKKLTEDLDDERDRINKLADDEAMVATRQRLTKNAEREAEQKIADETAGLLQSIYEDPDTVAKIMAGGKMNADFWLTAGQDAIKKGVAPNTLINFPSISNELNQEDKNTFTETVNMSDGKEEATPVGMGKISEGAELKAIETMSDGTGDSIEMSEGFSINKKAFAALYGEPTKLDATYGNRLAKLSQLMAQKPDSPKMESWKSEQKILLKDLATMKEAERDKSGDGVDEGTKITAGNISTFAREIRASVAPSLGLEYDSIEDRFNAIDASRRHMLDIGELEVSNELMTRNTAFKSDGMKAVAEGIYNRAVSNLTDYGFNIKNNEADKLKKPESIEAFKATLKAGKYNKGDVIFVSGKVIVYTGVADREMRGNPFLVLNERNIDEDF